MSPRLYYTDSFLTEFDAEVIEMIASPRLAIILDRTAFYPTSGGQVHDTGWIEISPPCRSKSRSDEGGPPCDGSDKDGPPEGQKLRVVEVAEREDGAILHYLDAQARGEGETPALTAVGTPALQNPPALQNRSALQKGTRVRGTVDVERRRQHMQQHSGQHVLSAAFIRLFDMPTVSFHMGDESCSIDLATNALKPDQLDRVSELANQVVLEDRPVEIRFASVDEARAQGVRKLPDHVEGKLRLIDIRDFDLNACGGTHVRSTGQIGAILLRKSEKVRQGVRVEFVCGERALAAARRDFATLTEAAALFSTHIWEVPQQVRKALEEVKAGSRQQHRMVEEIAELTAARLLAETEPSGGVRVVSRCYADRDTAFIRLLAQKLAANTGVVALLGSTAAQPSLVFAESAGLPFDMGSLMKEVMARIGSRGGGSRELAQGGAPAGTNIVDVLSNIAVRIRP